MLTTIINIAITVAIYADMILLHRPITTVWLNLLPASMTAISNTIKQVSGAIGTALLVTILTNRAHAAKFTAVGAIGHPANLLLRASNEGMNDAYFIVVGLVLYVIIKKKERVVHETFSR
jgi:hypothetical protein